MNHAYRGTFRGTFGVCLLLVGVAVVTALAALPVAARAQENRPITHAFFVAGPNFTGIIDEQGQQQWGAPRAGARDGWVLANGHILIAWGDEVLEFDNNKKVVWRYTLDPSNHEIGTVERLDDGNTLVTELGENPRLMEITPAGDIAVQFPLQPETDNAHMQTRMARKLPNGHYLVPHLLAFAVKEYTPKGEIVQTFRTDTDLFGGRSTENWPFTAIRLDNGHSLVGCTHGNRVVEFDPQGKVVWDVDNEDVDGMIHDACGVQRLPNGNTVIASYGARDGVKIFEVTPVKKVVWSYSGPNHVHHFQILTTNGEPLPGPPMK